MAEDLKQERNRLGNRVRELLWRYYPQMLGLTDDVAAPWFLDLWRLIPTPEKAARVGEATVDRLLKRHRIRRLSAADVLERLRTPAIPLAPGTVSAAVSHLEAEASGAMMGITLMPGIDDYPKKTEVTTVADAQAVETFAATKGMNTLSIWAIQRDNGGCPGNGGANDCSGIAQNTWDFSHVLEPFTK